MTSDREAFINSLPLRLEFHGWKVRLERRPDGSVHFAKIQQPKSRHKGMGDLEWEFVQQEANDVTVDIVKEFFRAFLATAVGQRLLTFGPYDSINHMREQAFTHAYHGWLRLTKFPVKGPKLRRAIFCIAYNNPGERMTDICSTLTRDKRGFCPRHSKQVSPVRTVFDYEPFSEMEQLWPLFLESLRQKGINVL